MAKFIALYTKPEDPEGFERYYLEQHLPLVKAWPKLQSYELTRVTGTPRGGEGPYAFVFEATFANDADLNEAMRSPEVRDAGMDAMQMCKQFGARAEMLLGTDVPT